jgi:hypothetical protein
MEDITRYINSEIILGDDILKVIKSFQETEWSRCSPIIKEFNLYKDKEKELHHTAWRWKNPDPQLDKLIVEAVNSFEGQVEWQIRFRERKPKLGGTNWIIETVKEHQFLEQYRDLELNEIKKLIAKEEPEIGILSNQDLPKLAEHIKRYVEENRQSSNNSQSENLIFFR